MVVAQLDTVEDDIGFTIYQTDRMGAGALDVLDLASLETAVTSTSAGGRSSDSAEGWFLKADNGLLVQLSLEPGGLQCFMEAPIDRRVAIEWAEAVAKNLADATGQDMSIQWQQMEED